jgi:hypothetical protein
MKTIAGAAIFALFMISIAAPVLNSAQTGGPSASGNYRLVLEDNSTKSVDFQAQSDERGNTTGQLTFTDTAKTADTDDEGNADPREEPTELSLRATLDGLTVDRNRAVMSGVITESNHVSYIGKWVQLVVEDNGEAGDQVNWRFCQPEPGGWVPVDAEEPRDDGAYWHWWATDAELREDVGIASQSVIPGQSRGCQSFSLPAYSFAEGHGEGQIVVRP